MVCHRCKTPMKAVDRQGVEIDYCPECRGVWLDRGELEKLIDRFGVPYEPPVFYGLADERIPVSLPREGRRRSPLGDVFEFGEA